MSIRKNQDKDKKDERKKNDDMNHRPPTMEQESEASSTTRQNLASFRTQTFSYPFVVHQKETPVLQKAWWCKLSMAICLNCIVRASLGPSSNTS